MTISQVLNMSGISRAIFEEVCLYHELFKEINIYKEAISTSIDEFVEKPITKLKPAVAKANEIVLMVAQMLACSNPDQETFKKEVLIGVGENILNEYKPPKTEEPNNLVTEERITDMISKKFPT